MSAQEEPEDFVAGQLVALFAEKNWLPHGAMVAQVFGDWFRIEIKQLEPNLLPPEVFEVDERAG